ncbi:MAG: hypothetical protein COB53_12735 [Elusimicrobia bacterium]|nr:MAG: hypothetical protein COB53_12735 [Elusimicrobiota bacterium]
MVLALVSGFAVTDVSAASDNEIIRDVFYSFSNGEQRLIRTMTAYEPTSEEFQDGLQAVIDAKGDPERFESEKNRFRLLWRGRVDDWSQRYEAKDPAILGSMSKISTPSREEFAAAAPWMQAWASRHSVAKRRR